MVAKITTIVIEFEHFWRLQFYTGNCSTLLTWQSSVFACKTVQTGKGVYSRRPSVQTRRSFASRLCQNASGEHLLSISICLWAGTWSRSSGPSARIYFRNDQERLDEPPRQWVDRFSKLRLNWFCYKIKRQLSRQSLTPHSSADLRRRIQPKLLASLRITDGFKVSQWKPLAV